MKTRCEIGKWSEKTYKLNEKGTGEDNKDMTKRSMFTRSRTIIDGLQLVCITVNTSVGSLKSLFRAKDIFSNTQCNLCILIYRYYRKCAILNKCMHKYIYIYINIRLYIRSHLYVFIYAYLLPLNSLLSCILISLEQNSFISFIFDFIPWFITSFLSV